MKSFENMFAEETAALMSSAFYLRWLQDGVLEFSLLDGITEEQALLAWKARVLLMLEDREKVEDYLASRFQVIKNLVIATRLK